MKFLNNIEQVVRRCAGRGPLSAARYIRRRAMAKSRGYPHTITFEAASVCNLKCAFCNIYNPSPVRGGALLPLATFAKVVDETSHFLEEAMFHWRGEPLVNKELPAMISLVAKRDIRSSLSTNGLLLTKEIAEALIASGLDHITICLDGTTQEAYAAHRSGGDLGVLLANIRDLVGLKKAKRSRKPHIDLQMIVTKKNKHQVADFERLARSLGADSASLVSLFIDRTADEAFVRRMEADYFADEESEGLSRYYREADGAMRMYGDSTPCQQDARYPVITARGEVAGCCYDIGLMHTFGICTERSFTEIWQSPEYRRHRETMMMPRKLAMCRNCMPKFREWRKKIF